MRRKVLKISGVLLTGYLGGWYAKKYSDNTVGILDNIPRKPGLPIFGSVSAAAPFVPDDHQNDSSLDVKTPSSGISKSSRVSQIMKYGFPGLDNVRSFNDYVLSYDKRNRVAHWVFEHITKESLVSKEKVDRSTCAFKSDESIHPYFRSSNSDYKKSGYDRGHMAAAGNHKSCQSFVNETFYLTNIAPQVGSGFNRDKWNDLENHVRQLTSVYSDVYVCTGPLYLPKRESDGKKYIKYEVIGSNHVAVPTHFYKIIVGQTAEGQFEMESYVMPNTVIPDKTPIFNFQVPPESIERAAGLLFFDQLSKDKLRKINGKAIK